MKLLTNLIFEPKGKHDPALAYSIKDTVMSADGSQVYFALQDVPAGTALDNEDYWKLQIDLHDTKAEMDAAAAAAAGAVSANVDQNLTETQKATARRNIGLDKVIESLSDPLEASGNPLVVKPVGGMPFESVVTEFSPQQSGSGDPYPAGGGRNLIDVAACTPNAGLSDRTITISGEIVSVKSNALTYPQAAILTFDPITLSAGTYTFVLSNSVPVVVRVNNVLIVNPGNLYETKTFSEAVTIDHIAIEGTEGQALDVSLGICLRADNVPEYAPYENIRPLSGWDKLNLNAAGKNFFPVSSLTSTGSANIYTKDKPFNLLAGRYTLSFKSANVTTKDMTLVLYAGETQVKVTQVVAGETQTTFTLDSAADGLQWYVREAVELTEIQLEVGSYASEFEPYQGAYHTLQIGQTVYGGRVNWSKGEMVVEWAKQNLRATYTITTADGLVYNDFALENKGFATGVTETTLLCSCLKAKPSFTVGHIYVTDGTSGYFLLADQTLNTTDKVNAYLETLDAQIAYKLVEPFTIQLTSTEIIALPGTNTLYGDGDTITVTGRQPKTNALESRLAALEAAMTNV